MAYAKIRPRRGTQYEWETYNPILAEGELAIQFPDTGIGTGLCKFKVGDGVSPWTVLPFAFDGTAAASIDGGGVNPTSLIQIRTATANAWANANPILTEREIAFCSDEDKLSIKIGDGVSRWNELSYIKASGLIENANNYDFGSEDSEGDNVMSLSEMEEYITANGNYEATVFENYNHRTVTPEETITGASNRATSYGVTVPEGVSTAGINDLLNVDTVIDADEIAEEEKVEEPVEEVVVEAESKPEESVDDAGDAPEAEEEKEVEEGPEEEVVEEEQTETASEEPKSDAEK